MNKFDFDFFTSKSLAEPGKIGLDFTLLSRLKNAEPALFCSLTKSNPGNIFDLNVLFSPPSFLLSFIKPPKGLEPISENMGLTWISFTC